MHDVDGMRSSERAGDLTRDPHRVVARQRANPAQPHAERLAVEVLHHKIRGVIR
jgi:hypothetical protein